MTRWRRGLTLIAAAATAHAADEPATAPPPSIPSCVGAGQPITFAPGDSRVLLREDDAAKVLTALVERYPVLQRDGFASSHLLLWRKNGGDWLYVTLSPLAGGAPGLCFTATFAAARFDFTPAVVQKYFFAGASNT